MEKNKSFEKSQYKIIQTLKLFFNAKFRHKMNLINFIVVNLIESKKYSKFKLNIQSSISEKKYKNYVKDKSIIDLIKSGRFFQKHQFPIFKQIII